MRQTTLERHDVKIRDFSRQLY